MSEALQTPATEMEPVIIVGEPTSTVGQGIPMDKLTNKITLYSGVMPLTMTLEALVEEIVEEFSTRWYVTLHLTGFGTKSHVFISQTVPIVLDTVTAVPFPPVSYPPAGSNTYGLDAISSTGAAPVTAMVKLSSPTMTGAPPSLQVINTTIDAEWVIGAIDILITDPPIVMAVKS